MLHLLEIADTDIATLSDSDLRKLVGLLCESELIRHQISTCGVTWGGHQDAPDGGIDVSVICERAVGFIPRQNNGFQVKASGMAPAAITKEMRRKGLLRDSIKALIAENGSYVIVSGAGSVTASELKKRLTAIRNAVRDEPNHQNLIVDFYDSNRIATWVRIFPSLVIWVRNRVGRSLQGWKSFDNWSHTRQENEEYLVDEEIRLYNGTPAFRGRELSVEAGINTIRKGLFAAGTCIRLAGLSGVGKTRFAQALFDKRIGEVALNTSSVLYTDMSDAPEPNPKFMAEQLIAQRSPGILIVDNCPPDLHRKLATVCSGKESTLSLLTIEYDVQEDLPEETEVFRIEPASRDIIVRLIRKRFEHISRADADTIAESSGGNARIAIALANTMGIGSTLSGLRDEELFRRLFYQRNKPDEQFFLSAQALSLVYSFDGEDVNDTSELSILGSLVGKSASNMYRVVANLWKKELVQFRSKWRAVLPHAVANYLARQALDSLPIEKVMTVFTMTGRERLLKSFAHRLNFLHDSPAAVRIADTWLERDGWLGRQAHNFNELGMSLFTYIAPLSPEKTLQIIERAAATEPKYATNSNPYYYKIAQLLRLLACEEPLFLRSVKVLILFALNEKEQVKTDSTWALLKSLFPLFYSGNNASKETRHDVIHPLLTSQSQAEQTLGVSLLDAVLEGVNFSPMHGSGFGVRPRSDGYTPQSSEERKAWYRFFIDKSVTVIRENNPQSLEIKQVLANKFRGLWCKMGLYDELETAGRQIIAATAWNAGWIEVKKTIQYHRNHLQPAIVRRLFELKELLNPGNLIEKIRTYALSDSGRYWDLVEVEEDVEEIDYEASQNRIVNTTIALGKQLVEDHDTFVFMLKELLTDAGHGIDSLGAGIAIGSTDKLATWIELATKAAEIEPDKLSIGVFMGFINGLSRTDVVMTNQILDTACDDPVLGKSLPRLQYAAGFDKQSLQRLYKALNNRISPISEFACLAYGRSHENFDDDALAAFLTNMLEHETGEYMVLMILHMRFHGSKNSEKSPSIIAVSRKALSRYQFDYRGHHVNLIHHGLAEIAKVAFKGEEAFPYAGQTCCHLSSAFNEFRASSHDHEELASTIAEMQPKAFLNVFVERERKGNHRDTVFNDPFDRHINPFDKIEDSVIIEWCGENPVSRYNMIMEELDPLLVMQPNETIQTGHKSAGGLTWKPIVYLILRNAPDTQAILNKLRSSVFPSHWSDSYVTVLQKRIDPVRELTNHLNPTVSSWAQIILSELLSAIANYKRSEDEDNHYRNESFE